jgi:hypothetical protein
VRSMQETFLCLDASATNPQRRQECAVAAGRRVPPREMTTAPGRPFCLKPNRELDSFVMKSLIEVI